MVPARPVLRRLIDVMSVVKNKNHFITLSTETKLDIETWHTFLRHYNGITFFKSLDTINASMWNMQSDASKAAFGPLLKTSGYNVNFHLIGPILT